MAVYTKGSWTRGCVHTIIDNNGIAPTGESIAKWLHSLEYNKFCDELQLMVSEGFMDMEKADKTYNAYAEKHETNNAYMEVVK